jgi:hypothetical protein
MRVGWPVRVLILVLLAPLAVVIGGAVSLPGPAVAAAPADGLQPGAGQFYGARVRVLDNASIGAETTISVKVTGVGSVPASGVSAVAINLAVKGASGQGRVRVFPSELDAPTAAEGAFYRQGVWDDYLLTVKVGADGYVKLRNPSPAGTVSVYADIHGYVSGSAGAAPGATYVPLSTARVVDNQSVPANGTSTFTVTGVGGVPSTGVAFVAFTLVVKGTATSKVTAYPSGTTKPTGVNVDYRPSVHMSNTVIVAPGSDGKVAIRNDGAAAVSVWADVAGYFAGPQSTVAGSALVALAPRRLVNEVSVAAGASYSVAPLGQVGVPSSGVTGVAAVVSAATSTVAGLLRVHPSGQATVPGGGSIAYGGTDSWGWNNLVPVMLGSDGRFVVVNRGTAAVTITVDTYGYFQAPAKPSAPSAVTARPGDGSATVSWAQPPDGGAAITGYRVTASPGGASVAAGAAARQATVAGLTNGTSYTFTVTATNAVGTSAASAASAAVVPGRVPGAPTNVVASAADQVASVSWLAPADIGSSPITGYTVTEAVTGKTVTTAGATSAVFTGLTNGTPYSFYVVATNAVGNSPPSAASNPVTPQPLPTPGQPLITDVLPRDGQVQLSWSPPPTGAAGVTTYRVSVQPGARTVQTASEVRTATVGQLTNGTEYTFTVTAVNANGAGPASLPAQGTPDVAQVPLQPVVTQVMALNGRIDVQWLSTSDGGSSVTSYRLSAEPGGPTLTLAGDAIAGSLTGLTNGTAYTVKLVAVNKVGASPAAVTADVMPVARRAPAAPESVSAAAAGSGQVEVGWAPPTDTGTSTVTGYTITAQPGGKQTIGSCASGQQTCVMTVSGLDSAVEYTFTVSAVSVDGIGAASAPTGPVLPQLAMKAEPWELTAPAAQTLTASQSDGRLVFDNPPPEVTDLTADQYVIIPPTPAAPDGLLRQITAVSTTGSRTVLTTIEAKLGDIVADGDFTGQVNLDSGDLAEAPPSASQPAASGARAAGELRLAPIPFHLHAGIGNYGHLDADLALAPRLIYHFRYRFGVLVSARVAVVSRLTGHVLVHTSHGVDWTKQFSIGKWSFLTMVKAGRSRIPIVVSTTLSARAHADASGALTLEGYPDIEAGIEGKVDGWHTGFSPISVNHSAAGRPHLDGPANARLQVDALHAVTVAGILGVGVEAAAYLAAHADVAANPWWWVRAGVVIRGCVVLLGKCTPADVSKDLNVTLISADGPFRGISVVPARTTIPRGRSVDFNVEAHNATPGAIRWEVISGPGTIDSNGLYSSNTSGIAVVRATDTGGSTDDPDAEAVVNVGPSVPDAPVDVETVPAPLSAHVSWQPAPNNLAEITGYAVTATPVSGDGAPRVSYAGASDRTLFVRDLTPDITYEVRVYATNTNGTSPSSEAVTVTPKKGITPEGNAVNIAVDAAGVPDRTNFAGWDWPKLSGDGRYAFFTTVARSNLMPSEAYSPTGDAVYLLRKDIYTGEIRLASRRPDGHTPAPVEVPYHNAPGHYYPSSDGSRVAYKTAPLNGEDPYGAADIIVQDIDGDDDWLALDGTETVGAECVAGMSGDGEVVLYEQITIGSVDTWSLRRQERGQAATTVGPGASCDFGAGLSASGSSVAYAYREYSDSSPNNWRDQIVFFDVSTNQRTTVKESVYRGEAVYTTLNHPLISPDDSTLIYHSHTNASGSLVHQANLVKIQLSATGPVIGSTVPVLGAEYAATTDANGALVGYGSATAIWGPHRGGVFEMDAGRGVATVGATTGMSYEGTETVSALLCDPFEAPSCTNGVWLQRYDVPSQRGNLTDCNNPDYGYIGQYERRTGIRAKLCFDMPDGKPAASYIKPPGWPVQNERLPSGEWRYARGHLLANQLGGDGTVSSNLVTMYQVANRGLMAPEEGKVAAVVNGPVHEKVYYYVNPVYGTHSDRNPQSEMPVKIHIVARGEEGFFLDACVPDVESSAEVRYNDPCLP